MGAFDLTDDNYRLLARRISGASRGHSCLLNPKVHVSPCDYFWLLTSEKESLEDICSPSSSSLPHLARVKDRSSLLLGKKKLISLSFLKSLWVRTRGL